ncbi:hypothetical protein [Natronorubrum daqingense]|uniref:Uncharacterized protein n=1 Tax=Natronorubrum daqingense TaxID=588898 RepID=A0A1N7FY49_9EURY|nr:hypothetical protein [Natronorubrum daqingense]SIS05252.1 hypothetical protein SAMN05421809_3563 [Natronorubrum daqingense]
MTLKKKPENAAERLAEETDRPKEEFEPDFEEYPKPELEDLEWETIDE